MPAYRMRKRARQQNEKSRHQRNNLRLSRLSQKTKEPSGSGRSGRSQWEVPHRDQSMGLKEMLVGLTGAVSLDLWWDHKSGFKFKG